MIALERWQRVALTVLFLVLLAWSMTSTTYAEAIILGVSAGALIAAILTACGIVMVDEGKFGGLVEDVIEECGRRDMEFRAKLMLTMVNGIGYIEQSIVELVALAANALGAYDSDIVDDAAANYNAAVKAVVDSGFTGNWATINGFSYPMLEADSVPGLFVPSGTYPMVFQYYAVRDYVKPFDWSYGKFIVRFKGKDTATWEFNEFPFFLNESGSFWPAYNYFSAYSAPYLEIRTRIDSGVPHREAVLHWFAQSGSDLVDQYVRPVIVTDEQLGSIAIGKTPSICAEMPWDRTDSLPSISADGAIALPGVWAGAATDVAGVRSLPLSVPKDTVVGAGSQSQTDAWSGTKVDGATAAEATDFFGKNKLKLSLVDFFPFCIPFDLIRAVELLNAPAKSPVFDIPIDVPYLGTQVVHIDLTQWEGVFLIGRWFLVLMFVIALAGITPKMIQW